MNKIKKQRGFINLDGLVTVFYLAAVGFLAIIGAVCYGFYVLIQHLNFI